MNHEEHEGSTAAEELLCFPRLVVQRDEVAPTKQAVVPSWLNSLPGRLTAVVRVAIDTAAADGGHRGGGGGLVLGFGRGGETDRGVP